MDLPMCFRKHLAKYIYASHRHFVTVPRTAFSDELIEHYRSFDLNLDLTKGLQVDSEAYRAVPALSASGPFDLPFTWCQAKWFTEGNGFRMLTPALYFAIKKWVSSEGLGTPIVFGNEWLDAVVKRSGDELFYKAHADSKFRGGRFYGIERSLSGNFNFTDVDGFGGIPVSHRSSGEFGYEFCNTLKDGEIGALAVGHGTKSVLEVGLDQQMRYENRYGVRLILA